MHLFHFRFVLQINLYCNFEGNINKFYLSNEIDFSLVYKVISRWNYLIYYIHINYYPTIGLLNKFLYFWTVWDIAHILYIECIASYIVHLGRHFNLSHLPELIKVAKSQKVFSCPLNLLANEKKNIIKNFIIQKLKSKHTSLKKYTNWAKLTEQNFSRFEGTREEKTNKYFAPRSPQDHKCKKDIRTSFWSWNYYLFHFLNYQFNSIHHPCGI